MEYHLEFKPPDIKANITLKIIISMIVLIIIFLLFVDFISADTWSQAWFHPELTNVTYYTPTDNISCSSLNSTPYCVYIGGGTYAGSFCKTSTYPRGYTLCDEDSDCQAGVQTCQAKLCQTALPAVVEDTYVSGGGNCGYGRFAYNYHCYFGTVQKYLILEQFDSIICNNTRTTFRVQVRDNKDKVKNVDRVYFTLAGREYDFVRYEPMGTGEYVFSDYVQLNTSVEPLTIYTVQKLSKKENATMNYTTPVFGYRCEMYTVDLKNEKAQLWEKITDTAGDFKGWASLNPEQKAVYKNKIIIMVLFGVLLTIAVMVLIVGFVSHSRKNKTGETGTGGKDGNI